MASDNLNSDDLIVTPEDIQKIKQEIKQIEEVLIPEANEDFEKALADGDLSENSTFDIAKDKLKYLYQRVEKLKGILKHAKVVKADKKSNTNGEKTVGLGSTVTLEDQDGNTLVIEIVTPVSADPLNNKFGTDSPLGKAVLGKSKGQKAVLSTPMGEKIYTVVKVEN